MTKCFNCGREIQETGIIIECLCGHRYCKSCVGGIIHEHEKNGCVHD
jgi:hypothetical protein